MFVDTYHNTNWSKKDWAQHELFKLKQKETELKKELKNIQNKIKDKKKEIKEWKKEK